MLRIVFALQKTEIERMRKQKISNAGAVYLKSNSKSTAFIKIF